VVSFTPHPLYLRGKKPGYPVNQCTEITRRHSNASEFRGCELNGRGLVPGKGVRMFLLATKGKLQILWGTFWEAGT
jgi:hypothetical protein